VFDDITKANFVQHFKKNIEFLKDIEYLPIGEVSYKGKTIILGTKSDKDTFQYYDKLKELYSNNLSYVFNKPGGHHMLFLYPEKYTRILKKLILKAERE